MSVVVITSPTSDKHRSEATRVGVDVYLTKPYQGADLLLPVRSLCAGQVDAEAVPFGVAGRSGAGHQVTLLYWRREGCATIRSMRPGKLQKKYGKKCF